MSNGGRQLRCGIVDEIIKVAEGPERFTVADMDALLYLPGHRRDQLQRALRIPALSPGWRGSFETIAAQEAGSAPASGNPGLSRTAARLRHGPASGRCAPPESSVKAQA